ncbi:MAG: sigma 54-interacting transcriptional regulator [candidate division Zixibacteria bacterium]|nr:sigma 54-interacting transcriptional regulator [candidate division Zixibacteria bacterium]
MRKYLAIMKCCYVILTYSNEGCIMPDSASSDNRHFDSEPLFEVARSKAFRNTLNIARRAARFNSSVLISGETGVGKEVVARFIHRESARARYPMMAVNCGALPETLLESELFGHKAGSFTGAIRDRTGLFEQAARGTILLDEIGDISLATQVKLLRVLQEREILRIGENIPRKVDTRIIAATNRNLDDSVAQHKFREDLLYRLRVIEIEVPPLRNRPDDILLLTSHFVREFSRALNLPHLTIAPECLDYFQSYLWPGNVRELRNAIERAAVLSEDGIIRVKNLPPRMVSPELYTGSDIAKSLRTLEEVELDHIREVLRLTGGNRTKAAKILGIGLSTLWRKLKPTGPS